VSRAPIVIAVGDPGGVGPIASLRVANERRSGMRLVLVGDAAQLKRLARADGIEHAREIGDISQATEDAIGLLDVGLVAETAIARHAPSAETGAAQLAALNRAAELVRGGTARALVTGPMSKEAVTLSGSDFVGQTEHLARISGLADDDVTMMFLGPRLRVALVTTHLAVADVSREITAARVHRTIMHLAEALLRLYPDKRLLHMVVAGLNPHAGEAGMFGREEIDVIRPVVEGLQSVEPFIDGPVVLKGPAPAEAVFRAAQRGDVMGVVAMIHDQATIASKLLDWGSAVNVTWGLPFVRTSVDHGVAYDAARDGTASAEGMQAALAMADAFTQASRG
jgi:4-hydroxythreonine-4-phosphate dehydrogenase